MGKGMDDHVDAAAVLSLTCWAQRSPDAARFAGGSCLNERVAEEMARERRYDGACHCQRWQTATAASSCQPITQRHSAERGHARGRAAVATVAVGSQSWHSMAVG